MDDFLIRALAAGLAVATIAGPLGSFVIWRRMAFFGDALGHAALLGVALGIVLDLAPAAGVAIVSLAVALALIGFGFHARLANDALLAILAYGALALGLVVLSLIPGARVDLLGFLFGDVLAVSWADVAWIAAVAVAAGAILLALWRPLLAVAVDEDLARAEGIAVARTNILFMLAAALVVAAAMKVVGVLLMAALLVVPAAAARPFARTPEHMTVGAILVGWAAVGGGMGMSVALDTPAGPSIVVAALVLFVLGRLGRMRGAA